MSIIRAHPDQEIMQDTAPNITADSLKRDTENIDALLEICREYFEIAIGARIPTEQEQSQAGESIMKTGFANRQQTPEDTLKVIKYPLGVENLENIEILQQVEYAIFDLLSKETDIIDAPYIPMFRYEMIKQRQLSKSSDYDTAILRQSAFLETIFKMKIGRWRHRDGRFINWDLCLNCAYQGEEIISKNMKYKLHRIATVRNKYAHDWGQYALNRQYDVSAVRDAFVDGLGVISELHSTEEYEVFEKNMPSDISTRYPTDWESRQTAQLVGSATAEVKIRCTNCENVFLPRSEGWKRCPECYESHNYLERFEESKKEEE